MDHSLPPPTPPSQPSPFHIHIHSSTSFPVIAIALIGIIATAFLLVGYYVFVIKCCLNWHRFDVITRLSSRRHNDSTSQSNNDTPKGLDEAIIRSIPVIKFRKTKLKNRDKTSQHQQQTVESYECAVCLSEFEDGERLRVIPNCCHAFHIDCIDIWLQNNANCPLCRSGISPSSLLYSKDRIFGSDLQNSNDGFDGNEDDYVVIEIQGNNLDEPRLVNAQENNNKKKKVKKLEHVKSMGDECIDMREKDNEFKDVQPIRRSISMDLSSDREFCIEIQQMGNKICGIGNGIEDCCCSSSCSSGKVRRSIFSFGYGRSCRGSVQPIHLDST